MKSEVCVDGKDFGFLVEVFDVGVCCAAGGYAEGAVLDSLNFLDVVVGDDG